MSSPAGTPHASKVPFDPGWNDPPPLSYSPQSQMNKPRNILNKRVAFPLSPAAAPPTGVAGVAPLGSPPALVAAPPPVHQPFLVSTPLPSVPNNESEDGEAKVDHERALKQVLDALYGVLDESSELGNKAVDIKKRIVLMEELWTNGKLNNQIQYKMLQLANALREGRPRDADELHKALMVEQAGAVSAWMPGVRRLVRHAVARHDLLAIDDQHQHDDHDQEQHNQSS